MGTASIIPTTPDDRDHPEGFAGPLDNWHIHYNDCVVLHEVRGFASTHDECEAAGGDWFATIGWMTHAYVWTDSPLGVFHMWNTNIPPVATAASIRDRAPIAATLGEGETAVLIEQFGFSEARIKVGETVVWTNLDGVLHNITSGYEGRTEKGFDSGYIDPGQSFTLKFDQPGEYPYTCTLHHNMNGTVFVVE